MKWLPDMDLNHDKQIQSLLCYRYTIGQSRTLKLNGLRCESRIVEELKRSSVQADLLARQSSPASTLQPFNASRN